MKSVNHFRVKREAHALSRRGTSSAERWNIFRHLSWDRPRSAGKSSTWDVADRAEAGRAAAAADDAGNGSPVEHTRSAPTWGSNTRPIAEDEAERNANEPTSSRDRHPSFAKDIEKNDFQPEENNSNQFSGDTMMDSQQTESALSGPMSIEADETVRRRRPGPGDVSRVSTVGPDLDDELDKKPTNRFFRTVKPKRPFTLANQIQRTFLNSWVNVLLAAAPIGIVMGALPNINKIAVFVVNFIAIIPLAAMLSFATEEIALRTGETVGGLLNATFGNAVELIVAIMALTQGKVVIVQTSLIGSILSNLLLVMGMCFFCGGFNRIEQHFNLTVAQTATSLLSLAVASIIVPTAFDQFTTLAPIETAEMSRGTAIILLVVYGGYLFFQLKTHHSVFSQESEKVPTKPSKSDLPEGAIRKGLVGAGLMGMSAQQGRGSRRMIREMRAANERYVPEDRDDDEGEDPQLAFPVALGVLVGSTVVIAFCAEFLVDSIDQVVSTGGISEEFLGLILLPIVGNAAEHATAVTVAMKDKMDLAIGVAVGSGMQVSLFLIPLLVVIGWGMGNPYMNLSFDVFQVVVLFVSVLLVNYLIADGKSHWLEGLQLMVLYLIIAVCSWWYPICPDPNNCPTSGTGQSNSTSFRF